MPFIPPIQEALMTMAAPGAGPAANPSTAPQAAPGQPFTNLQAYLTANAPQIQAEAQGISTNLGTQYGQAKSDIDAAKTSFLGDVGKGYMPYDPGLMSEVKANPRAVAADQGKVKSVQGELNDAYTGPGAFETTDKYGTLNKEVRDAVTASQRFTDLPSMQTYFQSQNPRASLGGNVLDAALLAGNPEAVTTIQNAAKPIGGLTDYLTGAVGAGNTARANAIQAAQDAKAQAQGTFFGPSGAIPSLQAQIQSELAKAQTDYTARNKENADIYSLLGDPHAISISGAQNFTPQMLKDLGITQPELNLFGNWTDPIVPGRGAVKLQNFFNPGRAVPPSLQNVASPDDYANAMALSLLSGTNPIVSGAGNFALPQPSLDRVALVNAIKAAGGNIIDPYL